MASKRRDIEKAAGKSELTRHIGFLIRKFYQKNQAIWQQLSKDPQMTSVQYAVLTVLQRNGPSSLTEIGQEAAMDPATTRGVVDRLRARGMISLNIDSKDRRKVIVGILPPGSDFLHKMDPAMPQVADATLQPLNPAERLALEFLLLKVTNSDGAMRRS